MPKPGRGGKGAGRRAAAPPSPLPSDLEDEVDKYHRSREKLSLRLSDDEAGAGLSDEEEGVMDLSASESSEGEEDEEELDTDDEIERGTHLGKRGCRDGRGGGGLRERMPVDTCGLSHMHQPAWRGRGPGEARISPLSRWWHMHAPQIGRSQLAVAVAERPCLTRLPRPRNPCSAVAKQAKALGAKLRIARGEAEEGEEGEEEEEEEGAEGAGRRGAAWGSGKRAYYDADNVDLEVRLAGW